MSEAHIKSIQFDIRKDYTQEGLDAAREAGERRAMLMNEAVLRAVRGDCCSVDTNAASNAPYGLQSYQEAR